MGKIANDVEISNKIILLNINTSTFEKQDVFMTGYARKQVLAQLKTQSQVKLYELLDSLPILKQVSDKVLARTHGYFEDIGEFLLAEGGTFYVRKMVEQGQKPSEITKISFPKRTNTTANYTSYSKLQDKAAQAKQAAEKANATKTKDIVSTIKDFDDFTKMLFRINHGFPTFNCVCYFDESISDDKTVEKGPCTFQISVGASHTNNVTWDSYNLFDSLYSSSNKNERKIKHFIVVPREIFLNENFTYKNSFKTNDSKLIEYLFEKATDKDKDNASEDEKKLIANKGLSEKFEQCVDQYCLNIDNRMN